ncbi:MAG: IclR family transcriptional regulator [Thermodesulfobacteriota bacterium]
MQPPTKSEFKRVPALDKCFSILELLSASDRPLGISEICKKLDLNKSTVFNIVHTLVDLQVLEFAANGKLAFGTFLYVLGKAASRKAELIRTVRPYLQQISRETDFSAFLGVRAGQRAVIVDKVDAAVDIKVSSEVGMRLPLVAGAGGKALLSLLPDSEIDEILATNGLKRFTSHTCVDKRKFKEDILSIRRGEVALDVEEYLDGIVAVAVPINSHREGLQAAIWAVGLKRPESDTDIQKLSSLLKHVAKELDIRFGSR